MKPDTAEALAAQVAQLERQESHLTLTIRFPPSGCRNVAVWRETQSKALECVRRKLGEQREALVRQSIQLEFEMS